VLVAKRGIQGLDVLWGVLDLRMSGSLRCGGFGTREGGERQSCLQALGNKILDRFEMLEGETEGRNCDRGGGLRACRITQWPVWRA
jgi:hypothetical protein